jgi:hypothetical protein
MMRHRLGGWFTALFVFSLTACPPALPPEPDTKETCLGGDACSGAKVCEHLRALGCEEGIRPNCAEVFDRVQEKRLTDLKPECLLGKKTKEGVRTCKSVACP